MCRNYGYLNRVIHFFKHENGLKIEDKYKFFLEKCYVLNKNQEANISVSLYFKLNVCLPHR